MTLRSISLLLLLVTQSALPGQDADLLMRKGDEALNSGLWEMAALHYNECLANTALEAAKKSQAAIRLAEAWIRDGKPAEALELLDQSFMAQHPETPFWRGQALAALGRFSDAVAILAPLTREPTAPFRREAVFTTASLELALGKPDAALTALSSIADSSDPALVAKARLHQVEILLDLGRAAEARETMPAESSIGAAEKPLATFLDANLLLAEDQPADAALKFQSLVDQAQGQSLRRHHAAVIGLADSLIATGATEAAADVLLNFIQEHPDTPQLEAMFKRLLDALPESPTPTDPVLERLTQWIPPSEIPATGAIAISGNSAVSAWPGLATPNELLAFSLYTRAIGLHRIGTPAAHHEARSLLMRLRLENPGHFLSSRALLLDAEWALEQGASDRAFHILEILRDTATSPLIQGEAAFLQARTAYQLGDRDKAIPLFEEAARSLSGDEANTALLNAAIVRLTESSAAATPILQSEAPENRTLATDLELERALSTADSGARRAAIEEFLIHHPDHPREAEARLAAADAALSGPSQDLSFARAQLETIAANPEKSKDLPPARVALVRLRVEDLSQDSEAAIAAARSILEQFPGDPAAVEASLTLGRHLFLTGNYNDARLILEKLAASDTDPARAQAAWLLAARSAALVPTSQSQQEALILFDKAIASQGPISSLAKLEKARLMIDMNRLSEASGFLREWFDELPETDPLHLPAGLMLGEAIYAQGSVNPNSLSEALQVYDSLLVHAKEFPAVFNRIQYLRGRTLEQIPDETDPTLKREKQAFIAYYSVLETDAPPAEWTYFELCGFRALALLEKAGRWPAAIACAKKIASFNGPRAKEAATRASQLQLKHMIWED